jgi:uncharacterized protein YndB with AHSA1/START domain
MEKGGSMTDLTPGPDSESQKETLVVRKTIQGSPERLWEAWTEPEQLRAWWGPEGVACIAAEVDLRPGGSYRIANQLPDQRVLWIVGEFELVEPPRRLTYTWKLEGLSETSERVTVQFEPRGAATEVVVRHERIPSRELRDQHHQGWLGCLSGLGRYLQAPCS